MFNGIINMSYHVQIFGCHSLVKPAHLMEETAPKAISNIRLRVVVNANGDISRRNVIYHRINQDGTIDKIERTWEVKTLSGFWLGKESNSLPTMSNDVTKPCDEEKPALKKYIRFCETKWKNHKPANVNVNRCGALLSQERLLLKNPD